MDWLLYTLIGILLGYCTAAWYIHRKKIREDLITFYGPIMAIKTRRIGFFDRFRSISTVLRIYGSLGIAMVAVVSVAMTILVLSAFHREVVQPPPPEGIFSLQNMLALPGVNQFIPFTIPVLLAIAITIAVHELGHGILCRVEGILVKSMGVLLLVIPIGFFVEPDEADLERTPPVPKSRMFGAGIVNNLFAGIASFVLLFLLLGMLVPVPGPVIYRIVEGSPAYNASVPLGSVILAVDGNPVSSVEDVTRVLNGARPGETLRLMVLPADAVRGLAPGIPPPEGTTYTLNLGSLPGRSFGYMGVYYYPAEAVLQEMKNLDSPLGYIVMSVLPIDILPMYNQYPELHLIFLESPDMAFYRIPFPLFWGVAHFLFWCGWFNFMVGTFNALPMVPLDGGFIMKEGVAGLLRRIGKPQFIDRVVLTISMVIFALILLIVTIPSIAGLAAAVGP